MSNLEVTKIALSFHWDKYVLPWNSYALLVLENILLGLPVVCVTVRTVFQVFLTICEQNDVLVLSYNDEPEHILNSSTCRYAPLVHLYL